MRILFWNIMHGGGRRAGQIVEQIQEWNPDIVALAEFRGTLPSQSIAKSLVEAGFEHQLTTVNSDEPAWNALCLASRFEVSRVRMADAPATDLYWLLANVHCDPPLHIGVIHVPLDEYFPGFWKEYRRSLLNIARDWKLGPSLFVGDMNSGISGLDEETRWSLGYKESFMKPMEELGWRDMFRVFHPHVDAPTWISRSGNGFRLDQAFVNAALQPNVSSCSYDWGDRERRGKLSDHTAILLDLSLPV